MIESFKEFSFEAKRSLPPHQSLQSHVFRVRLHMRGDPDPVYGWPANHAEVDAHFERLFPQLNRRHLNDIDGLSLPSLENIARWIWEQLREPLPALVRVSVVRGPAGQAEGCTYIGRP